LQESTLVKKYSTDEHDFMDVVYIVNVVNDVDVLGVAPRLKMVFPHTL